MRKFHSLIAISSVVLLAACGNSDEGSTSTPSEAPQNQQTEAAEDKAKSSESGGSFKDNILETDKIKIEIKEERVIPVGEPGNEYGNNPVLALFFDMTNKSAEQLSPVDSVMYFTAVQDNDPNQVNELEVAAHPDPSTLDSQMEQIKQGGTASGAVAFELTDETTPVELIASDNFGMTELGRQTFEITS